MASIINSYDMTRHIILIAATHIVEVPPVVAAVYQISDGGFHVAHSVLHGVYDWREGGTSRGDGLCNGVVLRVQVVLTIRLLHIRAGFLPHLIVFITHSRQLNKWFKPIMP